jgi:hypothetical protein
MHLMLSLLSSAVLAALVYGLSFFPSATLNQIYEVGHSINRADQNGANAEAQDAQAPSDALQS